MNASSLRPVLVTAALLLATALAPLHGLAALPAAIAGESLPSLAPMLEQATPAVVNIATRSRVASRGDSLLDDPIFRRFFNLPERQRTTQSLGSGVIVDAERGLLLTNNHVIEGAQSIAVTLNDGREFSAELVGADAKSDVAVLRIPAEDLKSLPWADSDTLRVGDFVVAIGNPFGLGQTVTSGIISALGRSGLGIEDYEDFIQTDASINPGNSGGALVNLRGELVGINTAILGPNGGNIGIGFAIPANMVRQLTEQLVEFGEVRRGRLGISAQDLTPALANAFGLEQAGGVVITQVQSDSPADRAGLRPGDVVVQLNDRRVRNADDMRNLIGLLRVGQEVSLRVSRDGKLLDLKASIAEAGPARSAGGEFDQRLSGATLTEAETRDGNRSAIVIADVEQGSAAWYNGLRRGDIVLSVNRRSLSSIEELRQILSDRPRTLLLNIQRGRRALFVLLQ